MKKNILGIIFISFLFFGCSSSPKKELYVIHVHGDWCMTCKTVDPVIHTLDKYFQNKKGVDYIVFDETNPETIKESKEVANKHDLEELFEYERHTGEVLFVDKKNKNLLTVFAGVGDKQKYIDAIENLLAGKQVKSFGKNPANYELSKPSTEEAQKAKLYVIDIHHDKCGTCAITVPTFEKTAKEYKDNSRICFLTFDLSTPKTINETRSLAKNLGLEEIYNLHKHTGEVLFVDAQTKNIKDSFVAETNTVKYHEIIEKILNPET